MQNPKLTDEELLSLLRENDHTAFEIIYRRYWKLLFRQLYTKCGNMELAEELTQGIFVSLWERRTTSQIHHLKAYLQAAARFAFINHLKSVVKAEAYADRQLVSLESQEDVACFEHLVAKELSERLEQGLEKLPPKTRTIFVLSRVQFLPVKKIAELLHLSEKAVEYHITKSLKTLRVVLRDYLTISSFLLLSILGLLP